ncbi:MULTISPECIES: hypothetical protein [Chryseobacterium]|uniref:VIT family n=2 Tax=Chryseobacterium gleum TaxID=250 RepID=A0A3S4M458_CHRGE|nr:MULTISPECIES: hypothetical protein [Chryseobacterium]EFK36125.1 membrane protein [Chryseobacterium gleum ATCC 35910]QQY31823.1 hypothetical protein I6I60_23755 [Chryseobacterium gleum]UMQ43143.1 hypothetical protein MKS83_05485 [Chryseobacterium sp. Y16C]VEE11084.1 VIT family [Chryseobacterium gleum]VFA43949.1 VIT family [Chryseobacterium indologenes]
MKNLFKNNLFALLLGLIDGILTVLALVTGHVLTSEGMPITLSLALKVAFATTVSGAFIYFFSEYSRQHTHLIHAEKQLNLASHGKLATTQLGKRILKDSLRGVIISSICNFSSAMIPMIVALIFPTMQWIALIIALIMLVTVGIGIAHLTYGSATKWSISLLAAGCFVAYIGYKLNVI